MLILLPPSEKKNEASGNQKFDISRLFAASELTSIRETLINKIFDFTNLPYSSPAIEIYSGVLYQSLDWQSLTDLNKKRGETRLLIISGLFGLIRPTDSIFKYKNKIENRLWAIAFSELTQKYQSELIVDCRSSTYKGGFATNPLMTIEVRVFRIINGERSVITHMSKKYRGELVRLLMQQASDPQTPAQLAEICAQNFNCELSPPQSGRPWTLDLLIS